MDQPITDYNVFFEGAKTALAQSAQLRSEEDRLHTEVERLSEAIESEKKAVADSIALTVKKRSDEVTGTYDEELEKGRANLKKVRARREKAKNQGIKERIEEETMELKSENRALKNRMSSVFKQDRVPAICNTNFYYTLFLPHRIGEYIKLILTFIVCFLAIPCAIYFLIPDHKSIYLIGIYVLVVLIFGVPYVIISNSTKLKHAEALKEGRSIRDEIHTNLKKIRVITSSINNDRDEQKYDLASFDDEIAHIEQDLADITMKKQDALATFENVTKNIIADEITGNSKARMDQLNADYEAALASYKDISAKRKALTLSITDNYEVYLGKEFLNPAKIDELAEIMSHGTVTNLSEAIAEYKNRMDE